MAVYRVEVLDEQGKVVADMSDVPVPETLDGVVVVRFRDYPSIVEVEHVRHEVQKAFPMRRVLILPPNVEFVRLLRIDL